VYYYVKRGVCVLICLTRALCTIMSSEGLVYYYVQRGPCVLLCLTRYVCTIMSNNDLRPSLDIIVDKALVRHNSAQGHH
jgi:hypothetical protein